MLSEIIINCYYFIKHWIKQPQKKKKRHINLSIIQNQKVGMAADEMVAYKMAPDRMVAYKKAADEMASD